MCDEALRLFVSEKALELHREYQRSIELKISILKKSIKAMPDNANEVIRGRLNKEVKKEAVELFFERDCHRLFFDSFSVSAVESPCIGAQFGSENAFVYELYRYILKRGNGIFCTFSDKNGKFGFCRAEEIYPFVSENVLVIDACEHSYFLDYGFNMEKYLRNALSHLNLAKLCGGGLHTVKKGKK